jgi:hypothetical protein
VSPIVPLGQARALLQLSQMLRGYVAGTGDQNNSPLFLTAAAALENRARNPLPEALGRKVDLTC